MDIISLAVGLIVGLLMAWSMFLLYNISEKQAKKREEDMIKRLEEHINKKGIRIR